jgi:hypothetical protein
MISGSHFLCLKNQNLNETKGAYIFHEKNSKLASFESSQINPTQISNKTCGQIDSSINNKLKNGYLNNAFNSDFNPDNTSQQFVLNK